jgi:DNA (cytosine-5)-methyltransferase 1
MTERVGLVLSLFPGIGLLDMAFEEEGFCVVRGPDLIFGGDIRTFHPPAGKFDGVIGGPPCQSFSALRNIGSPVHGNLIPEYERVVRETQPLWFLMENVRAAPLPIVWPYDVHSVLLNNRWLGEEQNRLRRFSFGTVDGLRLRVHTEALEPLNWKAAVTSAHGGKRKTHCNTRTGGRIQRYSVEDALETQGLPRDFFGTRRHSADKSPFHREAQLRMVANGVPLPMGRAVARAVKRALESKPLAAECYCHAIPDEDQAVCPYCAATAPQRKGR